MLASVCTLPGQSVCVGVFNDHLKESLSLNSTQLSSAYGLGTVLAAFFLPLTGSLMDRFGIRSTAIVVTCGLTAACFLISSAHSLTLLFFAFFLLRFFGQGSLSMLSNNSLAMWFHYRLGTVAGVCSVSVTIAMALSPVLLSLLIEQCGWRISYQILGLSVAVILLPLLIFVFRSRPEDVGQTVDGLAQKPTDSVTTDIKGLREFSVWEALRHPSYWILLIVIFSWAGTGTALIIDVKQLALTQNAVWFKPEIASAIFFFGAASSQLIGGFLADRVRLHRLILSAVCGMCISLLILLLVRGESFFFAYWLFGVSQGLLSSTIATIWARYYGRQHLGKIKGGVMMAAVSGSSIGPVIMGRVYDVTGDYVIAITIFLAVMTLCGLLALRLRSPQTVTA
jgi:MFS family permease